jgi:hypothetical protein
MSVKLTKLLRRILAVVAPIVHLIVFFVVIGWLSKNKVLDSASYPEGTKAIGGTIIGLAIVPLILSVLFAGLQQIKISSKKAYIGLGSAKNGLAVIINFVWMVILAAATFFGAAVDAFVNGDPDFSLATGLAKLAGAYRFVAILSIFLLAAEIAAAIVFAKLDEKTAAAQPVQVEAQAEQTEQTEQPADAE